MFTSLALTGLAVLALTCGCVHATVITAVSASYTDVSKAVASAKPGDVVQIPPGTNIWTSTVWATNAITVQGAGIDQTVIVDEVPRTATYQQLFKLGASLNQSFRLTGLTIRGGTTNTSINYNGTVALSGTTRNFRVDHVKFDSPSALGIYVTGWLYGVIDHCIFDMARGTQGIQVYHKNWNGGHYGDGSWADASYWGTEKAVYIEDNVFLDGNYAGAIDSYSGARWVFRYNSVTNTFLVDHGTDSSARERSSRTGEIYGNTFYWTPGIRNSPWPFAIYLRGGSAVIFSNTFLGQYTTMALVANYRSTTNPEGFPWSPWGPCWNTVLGVTLPSPYDGNVETNGYPAIDQVGRGAGDLLSGDNIPLPAAWPHQISEPVYEWSNSVAAGIRPGIGSQQPIIQQNRDFFNATPKPGYTPFTYPHPIVQGDVRPPPPTNLRILSGP